MITYLGIVFVVPLMIMIFIAFELLNFIAKLTERKKDEPSDMGR